MHSKYDEASAASASDARPSPTDEEKDLASYWVGPRNLAHHSKWPTVFRLHGSITPYMIFPLFVTALWATIITCISKLVYPIGINHVLLTVLGFVVGLSLSFRSSTAYERYSEGRKYWAQLNLTTQSLARLVWIHVDERPECATEDLLAKITFCNMLSTFVVALKHRLRFEPYIQYDDLRHRVEHLSIIAKRADLKEWKEPGLLKTAGMVLGMSMAESNPRELIKHATEPLGNVPLELLNYCSVYVKSVIDTKTLVATTYQNQAMASLAQMNDVLVGTERVLNTPMPVAYHIALAQITWVYILILPFQLVSTLGWIAILGTVIAAYIILGLALIGHEIENPFGEDVNDLPLDTYCENIRRDIELVLGGTTSTVDEFVFKDENLIMHPFSQQGCNSLRAKTVEDIKLMLKNKATSSHK